MFSSHLTRAVDVFGTSILRICIMGFKSLLASLLLLSTVSVQLSGSVGPTSSLSSKQSTICNVLDYGGSIGSSDIGPAISSAFTVSHGLPPLHQEVSLTIPVSELCPKALRFDALRACR